MVHEMKLVDKYFNRIKAGTKTIEMRLYDENIYLQVSFHVPYVPPSIFNVRYFFFLNIPLNFLYIGRSFTNAKYTGLLYT